jgi:hypothetical protein
MFPTLAKYNQIIQKPNEEVFVTLKGYEFIPSRTLPFKIYTHGSGSYAVVFKAKHLSKEYAIRCFISAENENISRYKTISKYLEKLETSWLVATELLENEILVDQVSYPLLKMEWINGKLLNSYIDGILDNNDQLVYLQEQIINISHSLEEHLVGHGDIQCGNIIVAKDYTGRPLLRLIDYDGMYTPALSGKRNLERGRSEFQHPARDSSIYNERMDRFSFWVILTALEALKFDRTLWREVMQGGFNTLDNLLFIGEDFADPSASKLIKRLYSLNEESLNYYLDRLVSSCKNDASATEKIAGFYKSSPIRRNHQFPKPQVLRFGSKTNEIKQGSPLTIEWEVSNAKLLKLDIGDEIISVQAKGSKTIFPFKSRKYKLTIWAYDDDQSEMSTEEIVVVNPIQFSYFRKREKDILNNQSFTLEWEVQNATTLHLLPDQIDLTGLRQIQLSTNKPKTYILKAVNAFYEETLRLEIDIVSEPKLNYYSLPKSVVALNESFDLSWEVEDCKAVELHWNGETAFFSPTASTLLTASHVGTGTLNAIGLDGRKYLLKEIKIEVCFPININRFSAETPKILNHCSTTLIWDIENATDITISPIGIDGSMSRLHRVFPNKTTTYELKAANALFSKSLSCTVEVLQPPIIDLIASSNEFEPGASADVLWEIQHALSARMTYDEENFDIPHRGVKSVTLSTSKLFTISVTALDGFTIIKRSIELKVILPIVIRNFKPLEDSISYGGVTELIWEVENAIEITILPNNINLSASNKLEVRPNTTTIYTLTAKNALHTVSKSCQIDVRRAPAALWKPLFIILGIVFMALLGWFYYRHYNRAIIEDEVYKHYHDGQKLALKDCDRAADAFRQAFNLNSKLPLESRLDSLNISAEQYELDGNKRCEAYGSSSPNIRYIIECNYKLAAALRGSAQPKTCK